MVHYFHCRADFFATIMFPIRIYASTSLARAAERNLIHTWKPSLNMPWIANSTLHRLHVKVFPSWLVPCIPLLVGVFGYEYADAYVHWVFFVYTLQRQFNRLPTDCWSLLVTLSQGGKQAFDMETYLRSAQFSTLQTLHVYGRLRMCNLLDDPPRTAVKAALKRVLGARKTPVPRPARPLCLPPLAHPSFKRSVQSWITRLTKKYADFLTPFHLPCKSVVAGSHPSFKSVLYIDIATAGSWNWDNAPARKCAKRKPKHPNLECTDGHLARPAH